MVRVKITTNDLTGTGPGQEEAMRICIAALSQAGWTVIKEPGGHGLRIMKGGSGCSQMQEL